MDSFNMLLKEVMEKPSRAGLQLICSQVEAWDSYMPLKVKEKAQKAVTQILADGTLAAEEDMLRLYRIMAKHSRRMGASKVFEKVEEQGRFSRSLKFHLLWAETYAQSGNLDQFTHVLSLAKSRLPGLSQLELEAGFRDFADQYFPNSNIFNDEEETMAVFNVQKVADPKAKRNRRRSSLAAFEARAKDNLKTVDGLAVANFGPKTRTKLRIELVDRHYDGYLAPSIEELRAAMIADQQLEKDDDLLAVPMDITMSYAQEAPASSHQLVHASDMKELGKRNRVLETVEEVESDFSNEDKRRRMFSPAAPVRGSVLEKQQKSSSQHLKSSTRTPASSTFVIGSSFTEKAYNDMKAMLSDTVDINKAEGLPGITDETTLPVTAPAIEAFEVFIDKDESQHPYARPQDENLPSNPATCPRADTERAPLQHIPIQDADGDSGKASESKKKSVHEEMRYCEELLKPRRPLLIEDEETMAGAKFSSLGIDKKPDRGIVTSTPAHQMFHPPTHEDFFAPLNEQLKEQAKKEEDEEEIYARSAFMRRRSVAPSKSVKPEAKPVQLPRTVQAAERSMELALDKMNLGESPGNELGSGDDLCDAHNRTGVGLVMEAVTSEINPWDRNLRMEILRRSRTPCYQHNFDTPCLRISAGKTMNFGGEAFYIETLIGQGGFAKVYKAVDETGKMLALKYEIPSCPWEIYICSEVKLRLGHNKQFTLDSVMQVTDAYVFTNASVLFNEYHPLGTLLDLSSKLNDPSWYIILLIAIQMAKILRDVHGTKIIHGDVKPDNFMILNKLDDSCIDKNRILSTPVLKLIDWGRAIDMEALRGQTFSGRAGTDKFDCSEMLDGRPWTYQTDYFGYVGTLHVLIFNKYAEVRKEGEVFKVQSTMKRRLPVRPLLERVFHEFLNIPSCDNMPNWDNAIKDMEELFHKEFSIPEWRQAAGRFNDCL
ncbi:hypothetical protein V3C99_001504 [Haemonchus contortus]